MLPIVVTYNVSTTSSTTALGATQGSGSGLLTVTNKTAFTPYQQRVTITSAGNDTGIYFHIIGLNDQNYTISEYLVGGLGTGLAASAVTVQSNLDYGFIISIQPSGSSTAQTLGTTAGSVSVGLNGVGSSLWNIVNWHAMPSNISYGTSLDTAANATWSIQYTYDDPNNLAVGVTYPQPFNHPTIVNATATIDGASNDPITAWRVLITAGTGIVRAVGIQGGIGSP